MKLRSTLFATFLALPVIGATNPLPAPDARFPPVQMEQVRLGQLLFYDPILSGNKSVSCATCHHPNFATTDGVSLGIGDGGIGLGPDRHSDPQNPPEQRIPRNAPALFNLGANEFAVLFHDGRLEADSSIPGGFRTPLGEDMETGFDSVLSAQTMFPVLSPDEMAGHYTENDVAKAIRQGLFTGPNGAWDLLSSRVARIETYEQAFEGIIGKGNPIHFSDISNAIAAFMSFEWRADDSPFDRFLRDGTEMGKDQTAGMNLFYGKAQCSMCHSGQFQTDHKFHAVGMPQIGPGKAARFESHQRDTGRMRVTGDQSDAYKFRTPSLRNITHTAPYGHTGAISTLEEMIRHHIDPAKSLRAYKADQAILPTLPVTNDFDLMNDPAEMASISDAISIETVSLSDTEIQHLIAFLGSLTDQKALKGRLGIPQSVPSGLPIDR